MDLLLIRHAIAEDRGTFAATNAPDSERPLTGRGAARMARNARGLRRAVRRLDVIATSPYVRARQTAAIVAAAFDDAAVAETDTLEPTAAPSQLADWLREVGGSRMAAVGHEPHLSACAAWFVGGDGGPFFAFKKGGACFLSFAGPIDAGTAELRWVLPPKLLRALGA